MDQKYFDRIINKMEQIGCDFRGYTLTKDQFDKVEELMDSIEKCYYPSYVDSLKHTNEEDEIAAAMAASICAEIDAEILADITAMCAGCDDCNQKEESGGFISDIDFAILMAQTDNVIINTRNEKDANYDDAMKVVK